MHRKHTYMWAAVIAGSMVVSGCAGLTKGQADLDIGMKERGIASWYGDDFHGWVTASGEMYDMHTLTAAHRTLPLGTIRINDRGPYVNGRILDLSYAAAKRLDMLHDGISAIQLEVVGQHGLNTVMIEPTRGTAIEIPPQETALRPASVSLPQISTQMRSTDRNLRFMPIDVLRERRARRVGDILAADRRVANTKKIALPLRCLGLLTPP